MTTTPSTGLPGGIPGGAPAGTARAVTDEAALVAFALAGDLDHVSLDRRRHLKRLVLDTLAIALGAAARGPTAATRLIDMMAPRGTPPSGSAAVWGMDARAPAPAAAFLNATNAEVMDYQEVLIDGRNNGHAAAVMVPALLALAEARGIAGRDVLAALAVGLVVNRCLLRGLGRAHRAGARGIRTTALGAPVATALAGARLIGLDADRARHAMNLAASALPAGLLAAMAPEAGSYSADKDTAVGLSARHAVESVLFAEAGVDAASHAVTGPRGWLDTFGQETARAIDRPNPDFEGVEAYAIKRFAANFGVQSAIVAVLDLRQRLPTDAAERIAVEVKSSSAASLATRAIVNPLAARFSLAYAVARTWLHGAPGLDAFEAPAIGDAAVLALMDRVEILASDAFEEEHHRTGRFPARVVVTQAGRAEAETVMDPWADLDGTAMDAILADKTRALLAGHREDADIAGLIDAVGGMDAGLDWTRFSGLLGGWPA